MIARRTSRENLPTWPADCFDDRPLEALSIPPGNRKALVCEDYPDCGCEGDCELPPLRSAGKPGFIIALMLFALAVMGTILLWLGLRP